MKIRLILRISVVILLIVLVAGCKKQKPDDNRRYTVLSADTSSRILLVSDSKYWNDLYLYNLNSKIKSKLWTGREKIIKLSHNAINSCYFFVTVSSTGATNNIPYFKNAKLYFVKMNNLEVSHPYNIGDGIQMLPYWLTDSTVKFVINKLDALRNTQITQKKLIISSESKEISEENKMFNITKDGYPIIPNERYDIVSASRKYSIVTNDKNYVFLYGGVESQKLLSDGIKQKLEYLKWSSNEKYLALVVRPTSDSTTVISEPAMFSVKVFSLEENKGIESFQIGNIHSFEIIRDLFIYDNSYGAKQNIYIFDLKQKKLMDSITTSGSCGLQGMQNLRKEKK